MSSPSVSSTPPPPPPPGESPPNHGNSQYTHKSSPRKTIPYHAEQIRDEIAWANAMNLTIRMKTATEMRKALAAGGKIPSKPRGLQLELNFGTFTQDSNKLSEFVHKNYGFPELILFLYTESVRPAENPVASQCRPDYVVVLKPNLTERGAPWPWMEVVGEKASKGDKDPLQKTLSYLHYSLLARPERKAGAAFLVSSEGVTFFIAYQGNREVQCTLAKWGSPELQRLMFALVYRLYHSESCNWVNHEYVKKKDGNGDTVFDIRLNGRSPLLKDFKPVYSRTPFDTRTHILVNPQSEAVVEGKPVTVVKDELARTGTRFTEKDVYERIHKNGPVPGVAQPSFHHVIKDTLHGSRERRLTGLQEYGHGIMMAKTLRQVLEIFFDILELLRYLYAKYRVLHRDISRGNIMFVETPTIPSKSEVEEHKDLCFARHLVNPSEHPNPLETSVLLVDFNNGEILDELQDDGHERTICTGTPGFVARAVQKGAPLVPLKRHFIVEDIPDAPPAYQVRHPERYNKFPPVEPKMYSSPKVDEQGWRHDLDHEAESVFWVLVYWLMAASPVNLPEEKIGKGAFTNFTGDNDERDDLISGNMKGLAHSHFEAVMPLIKSMAGILQTDRFWLPKDDPRNHPEYVGEAFQRLALDFLGQHHDDKFMDHKIDPKNPRFVEMRPQVVTISCTPSQLDSAKQSEQQRKKRKLDLDAQPRDDDQLKKQRVDEGPGPSEKKDDDQLKNQRVDEGPSPSEKEEKEEFVREEGLEPEKAFPDGFEAKWTAGKETHWLCFKEVDGLGQVEAELVELLPEEVAERDKAHEAMVEQEADESEEEGELS